MPSRSIPRKYAEALFHLAEETDGIDAVRRDLENLAEVLRQTPALNLFIESPDVAQAEKTLLFESTIRGKVKNATWQFLQLLLRRKRAALLPEILSEYVQMDEEKKGIRRVTVVSAVPLDKSEKELLTLRLRDLTGKTILIDTQVDPSILGGVVVYLDGKVIDGSVRTGLEELKARLLARSIQ
jgi:F-type H+-transporting ATPase subunit delta